MVLTDAERAEGVLSEEHAQAALTTFREAGYVVIENAYDPAFLHQVRAAYEVALEKHIDAMGGRAALEGKTFGTNHVGFFPPLYPPVADSQLAAHPIAVQLMKALLGPELQCSFYHTNTALPGSGTQPIHRDIGPLFGSEFPFPHPVTSLVFNVPLCDFTLENGATEVWPGTHLIVDTAAQEGTPLEERAAHFASTQTVVPLGCFILRDMRMWHRGVPNHSDEPRTMMAIVYSRGFLRNQVISIPRSTWESWSDDARQIFRNNKVVEDDEHQPRTWGT